MGLRTPCAGHRVFGYLLLDCGQKVKKLILVLLGQKILIFGAPETKNIDFYQKY